MTPKCGRIDVKYANFSYHTRIGLGKWMHDPTLGNHMINLVICAGYKARRKLQLPAAHASRGMHMLRHAMSTRSSCSLLTSRSLLPCRPLRTLRGSGRTWSCLSAAPPWMQRSSQSTLTTRPSFG